MSAEYPRYPSPFRRRRPIRPIQRPIGKHTETNLMNAELNLDWDDNINTDIWVSKKKLWIFFDFKKCCKNW